jgi:hypothetical protein
VGLDLERDGLGRLAVLAALATLEHASALGRLAALAALATLEHAGLGLALTIVLGADHGAQKEGKHKEEEEVLGDHVCGWLNDDGCVCSTSK